MYKWWTQFKLENRFIYRNWFFLLAPFAFAGFLIVIFSIESSGITNPRLVDASTQYLSMMNSYQSFIQTLTLGIIILLAVLSIRRHYNTSAYSVSGSWPVSQTTIVSAKYIAGILYASIFTLMMSVVFWFLAIRLEVNMEGAVHAFTFYVLHYEWSYAITLALGMFLAAAIPGRVAYLIAFCGWMFGTFFLDQFIIYNYKLYYLKTFHLNQLFVNGIWHSFVEDSVWGLDLIRQELWFSRLFVFAFATALLAIMLLILKNRRPTRSLYKWGIISIGVLLFTVAAGSPYFTMWTERYTTYNAHVKDSVPYTVVHPEDAVDTDLQRKKVAKYPTYKFPVASYIIKAKQIEDDRLAIKARVTVPAKVLKKHNPLTFTLNRSFNMKQLSLNGQSVHFTRNDDHVTIDELPGSPEKLTFLFRYEGTVQEWGYTYGEKYYGFVRDDSLFVPSYIGWYPLPGKQPLYVYEGSRNHNRVHLNSTAGLTEKGADFTVTLDNFHNKVFTTIQSGQRAGNTQIFTAKNAGGVSLVGGNLSKITDPNGNIVLIGPTSYNYEMKQMLDSVSNRVTYYRNWLELPNEREKLFFLRLNVFLNNGKFSLDSAIMINAFGVTNLYRDRNGQINSSNIGYMLKNALLYDSYDVGFPLGIRKKIHEFINEMYNIERNGGDFPKTSYEGLPEAFTDEHHTEISNAHKMTDMVNNAVDEGKIDQVKQVLKFFYQQQFSDVNGQKPSHKITFQDWQQKWNQVMNGE